MRGTLTFAGQRLTAALIIAISFSASGCMDSATVNPVAELASLTVTPGTLQPAFTGGTTQYTVDLTREVTSVRITAQPAVAGDTVTINGQATTSSTIALGPEGSTTSVSIVVSESSNNSRTYIVLLKRASLSGNNSLASLAVSPGTLAPAFNANRLNYSVDVANNIGSVDITLTLQNLAATMSISVNNGPPTNINSGETRTIPLGGTGSSTLIDIAVTAQNGNQKTYRVTVNRGGSGNNFLQSLAISPGTLVPDFSPGIEGYTVNLPSILPGNPTSMTVTPTLQDLTARMSISVNNGPPTNINSGETRSTPLPTPGSTTFIAIVVAAQNGTTKTYSINVIRVALNGNNFLSALTISPGTLAPFFSAGIEAYTVDVASSVSRITVTPTLQDATASMTVNGTPTNSEQARTISLGGPGSNTVINIVVTAQNGTPKTYSINVTRAALSGNNNLSALTVTPGALSPAFSSNTLSYTVGVASDVTSVTVTATLSDTNASMMINGQGTSSGQARTISLGADGSSTAIEIIVTPPNGNSKTYTVTVNRAALSGDNNLSALTVTPGALSPAFAASAQAYTVGVASDVTSVTVTATLSDTNASMTINGQGTSSGQARDIGLGAPGPTSIQIVVIAPNGISKTYTVTVNRAAPASDNNLSGVTVTPGSLVPTFASSTTSYTVDVATDVTEVTVTATKSDPNAVLSGAITDPGAGQATGQANIPLGGAGTTTPVTITVTAPNGNSKAYTITVNRAP
ncbi:MAG: cadherin-like beta sandwich domain-containing protein [Nitrospira sp.]|nr:cadherin-like beta sandwich domain-containing protein [Nitrospira sp.]